jgi:hypothetical protein
MNTAAAGGGALTLRRWLVDSDAAGSPQAAVLSPEATLHIAGAITAAGSSHYRKTIAAGLAAVEVVKTAGCKLSAKEQSWLDRVENELHELPDDEAELFAEMRTAHAGIFDPSSYGF